MGVPATQVIVEGTTQHDDVVDVDEAVRPLETGQDEVHQPLERYGSVTQPEWHDLELEQSLGRAESGLLSVDFVHFHLPVTTQKVERAEPLRSVNCIEGCIDPFPQPEPSLRCLHGLAAACR